MSLTLSQQKSPITYAAHRLWTKKKEFAVKKRGKKRIFKFSVKIGFKSSKNVIIFRLWSDKQILGEILDENFQSSTSMTRYWGSGFWRLVYAETKHVAFWLLHSTHCNFGWIYIYQDPNIVFLKSAKCFAIIDVFGIASAYCPNKGICKMILFWSLLWRFLSTVVRFWVR